MGVLSATFSMSTTADVVYTHKKFKRATTESWDGTESETSTKNSQPVAVTTNGSSYLEPLTNGNVPVPCSTQNILQCEYCGVNFENDSELQLHILTHKLQCSICKITFDSKINLIKHIHTENHFDKDTDALIKHINVSSKRAFNPEYDAVQRDNDEVFDNNTIHDARKVSDNLETYQSVSKAIYKPKFRAQYSHEEISNQSIIGNQENNFRPEILEDSKLHLTYQENSNLPLLENESTKSSNTRTQLPVLDLKSIKKEGNIIGSWSNSPNPASIWKGIKSPSPELVGQHINKLITENQAIVETHNSLWALKHRRQSSISSSSSDSEGSTGGKHGRRFSLTDSKGTRSNPAPYLKDRSHSLTTEPHAIKEIRSSFSPSLPNNSYLPLAHPPYPTACASKAIISSSGPTSSWVIQPPIDLQNFEPTKKPSNEGMNLSIAKNMLKAHGAHVDCTTITKVPHDKSFDFRRQYNAQKLTDESMLTENAYNDRNNIINISCTQCGANLKNMTKFDLNNHMKHHCTKNQTQVIIDNKTTIPYRDRNVIQEESALDLHKTTHNTSKLHRSFSYYGGYNGESSKTMREDQYINHIQNFDTTENNRLARTKKRKLSLGYESPQIHHSSLSTENKQPSQSESTQRTRFNNNRTHFLGGGEVQICDKNQTAIKLDQNNPSLNLAMMGPYLNTPKLANSHCDPLVTSTVLVTIAKSGLNSGGTVQVESQSSSTTKTVNSHSSTTPHMHPLPFSHSSRTGALSEMFDSRSKMHYQSPFIQCAPQLQLPNLTIPGVPTPNMSALMHSPAVSSTSMFTGGLLHTTSIATSCTPSIHHVSMVNSNKTDSRPPIATKESKVMPGIIYPRTIVYGEEKIPYVPGIPGPYSQSGEVDIIPRKFPSLGTKSIDSQLRNSMPEQMPHISILKATVSQSSPVSLKKEDPYSRENVLNKNVPISKKVDYFSESRSISSPISHVEDSNVTSQKVKHTSVINIAAPPTSSEEFKPTIIQKPLVSTVSCNKEYLPTPYPVALKTDPLPTISIINKNSECENLSSDKPITSEIRNKATKRENNNEKDDNDFLVPRKRPNTLEIKPQSVLPKSSLSLIGSTLVSPDTPRPKKSCAQLLLNGSAYTYLGLKVTTRCFFCCIYRPQPMYVPQSTNPKLSMYSNWQLRKPATDNPFNLDPGQAMSLYVSKTYNNQAYSIARSKSLDLIVTHSAYWTFRDQAKKNITEELESKPISSETEKCIEQEPESKTEKVEDTKEKEIESGSDGNSKRIKIFEGGFKTNEDYTYVRGRGRGRYLCGTCGIRCKKPSMLKKHIRTHTDLRPYSCTHCSFSFKTKGNLTKHLKAKAHYKRCIEIGINPVPTTVDDSHINKSIQGLLEPNKDGFDEPGDDDEEDDEEEDGEGDDDAEDEDTEEEQFDIVDKTSKSPIEESWSPIDLSVKRPSVLNLSTDKTRSTILVQPSNLSTKQKIEEGDNVASPSTPYKEHSSVILSPVTESSLLLKSIYSSTMMAPSNNKKGVQLNSDPSNYKTGHMLQAYLKECAVLDTTIKRHQYQMSSSSSSDNSPVSPSTHHPPMITSTYLSKMDVNSPSVPSTTLRESSTSSTSISSSGLTFITSVVNFNSEQTRETGAFTSHGFTTKFIESLVTSESKIPQVKKSVESSNNVIESTSSNETESSNITEQPNVCKVDPTDGDDINQTQKETITTSATTSSVPSLTATNNPLLSNVTSSTRMPTPPANLTVLNSCGTDSKTAFLAPGGVIPSSTNRMGPEDGKCRCNFCHKEFGKQSQLSLHINIHYMERPFRCEACGVSFRSSGHLQKHKRSTSHYNKLNMNMTFGTPSTDNPRPFKCHDCKIAFRIHGHLSKHLRSKMHIMKLECVSKLPFGTYAEIERSGISLNEIDTSDCENSLESLQVMAKNLYDKDPSKFSQWQKPGEASPRIRTFSNSSTNSDDYVMEDDQDEGLPYNKNIEDSGEDEEDSRQSTSSLRGSTSSPVSSTIRPGGDCSSRREGPGSPSPLSLNNIRNVNVAEAKLASIRTFPCTFCSARFSSPIQLKAHLSVHKGTASES